MVRRVSTASKAALVSDSCVRRALARAAAARWVWTSGCSSSSRKAPRVKPAFMAAMGNGSADARYALMTSIWRGVRGGRLVSLAGTKGRVEVRRGGARGSGGKFAK
jgi:hypothetical protein